MKNSNTHFIYNLKKFDDVIKLVNINMRAGIKVEVTFQIGKELPYLAPSNSISTLKDLIAGISKRIKHCQFLIDHEEIIEIIQGAILCGIKQRTDLVEEVCDWTEDYKHTVYSVLDELEGKFWKMTRGLNNSQVYSII